MVIMTVVPLISSYIIVGVGVEFNATPDTIQVILEAGFAAIT